MGGAQGPTRRSYLGVQRIGTVLRVVEGVGDYNLGDGTGAGVSGTQGRIAVVAAVPICFPALL